MKICIAVKGVCATGFINRSSGKYHRPEFTADTLASSYLYSLLPTILLDFWCVGLNFLLAILIKIFFIVIHFQLYCSGILLF